jgi:oligo-1,6-glucosidase
MLTLDDKVKDLYKNPVGHDIIEKLLLTMGKSSFLVKNPIVSNMKLETLVKLAGDKISYDFAEKVMELVNAEEDIPVMQRGKISKRWWKEAVFYQIYPRSFLDTNGDGIGDLRGIIEKVDYLKDLGVDAIWLSPVYDSPNDDNGYDIRDYRKIMAEFGTMEDFDELLKKLHEKDMKLIMDLVVNHTSDEHEWFKEALRDENSKYRDYYFFRKGTKTENGKNLPPNNWRSFFAGSAWNYYKNEDIWALHLFSKKQMDLNWDNENVRNDVIDMINWWLDKGVDGFRMDVISLISKKPELPEGDEKIGEMMGITGIENYYYGPHLHEYLREIRARAFDPHRAFSVGETPGLGMEMCKLITGEERKELDMVFCFDHLETPGHGKYEDYEYDLNYFRDFIINWTENYGDNRRMALFYDNHDNPRMISKITHNKELYEPLAKLLALMQFTLKGTPFVYQGEEMGISNYEFTSMDQITDVEGKGTYAELLLKMSAGEAFHTVVSGTREHARVLLPWNSTRLPEHEGLDVPVYPSVTKCYKDLIALRRSDLAFAYGDFYCISKKKDKFVYKRSYEGREYIIDCNLSGEPIKAYNVGMVWELIYTTGSDGDMLAPYEARIYKLT